MPEAYTHIRTARAAAAATGVLVPSKAAFEMGANGPDPLFAYRPLTKITAQPIKELGSRMHKEHCGAFLTALVMHAKTDAQKSYAMGFLSHNALDALMHPYIAFLTQKGQCYQRAHGHGFFETALDSQLYKKDYNTRSVEMKDSAPIFITAELAEVCELMQRCIREVFAQEVSVEALADSYHSFHALHRFFAGRTRLRRAVGALAEVLVFSPGLVRSHMTPAIMEKHLPRAWTNPYTGETFENEVTDLLQPATEISGAFLKSAEAYWQGRISAVKLARIIGDHSYDTGLASEEAEAYEVDEAQ